MNYLVIYHDDSAAYQIDKIHRCMPSGEIWVVIPPWVTSVVLPETAKDACFAFSLDATPAGPLYGKYYTNPLKIIHGLVGSGVYHGDRDLSGCVLKSLALAYMIDSKPTEPFIFFDVGVEPSREISIDELDRLNRAPINVLDRRNYYPDTALVVIDPTWDDAKRLAQCLVEAIELESVLFMGQWDMGELIMSSCRSFGLQYADLASEVSAAHDLLCGPYEVLEAATKTAFIRRICFPKSMNRYAHLIDLVSKIPNPTVIEIGTWNGFRALEMFSANRGLSYIGFDLFGLATEETDKREKNVKPPASIVQVLKRLSIAGVRARLIPGDTNETFTEFANNPNNHAMADIVWIDGGHSIDTIKADLASAFKCVKPDGVILLDDYYTEMPEEELRRFGCQDIVKDYTWSLFPTKDEVFPCGKAQIAMIRP